MAPGKSVYHGMAPRSHLSSDELSAFIDGYTTREQWGSIVRHLAACDGCFRELVTILKLLKDG